MESLGHKHTYFLIVYLYKFYGFFFFLITYKILSLAAYGMD